MEGAMTWRDRGYGLARRGRDRGGAHRERGIRCRIHVTRLQLALVRRGAGPRSVGHK